jgi:hypothetical protein
VYIFFYTQLNKKINDTLSNTSQIFERNSRFQMSKSNSILKRTLQYQYNTLIMAKTRLLNYNYNENKNQRSCLILLHQNAQGATNKIDELNVFCSEHNPDIFIVTEHGFKNSNIPCFKLEGYKIASQYCRMHYKLGGVIIFSKTSLNVTQESTFDYLNIEKTFEISVTSLCLHEGVILIVGLYRSPNYKNIKLFFNQFEMLLNNLVAKKLPFIICGDFNINTNNADSITSYFKDVLSSFNLSPLVKAPTRVTNTSATIIDNVISNISDERLNISIINSGISDHYGQRIVITKIKPSVGKNKIIKYRDYTKENLERFKTQLRNQNWEILKNMTDIEAQFEYFNSIFCNNLNSTCPYKIYKNSQFNTKKSHWITKGILISRKRLKSLYLEQQNDRTGKLKQFYKIYKRIYKKVINAAKNYDLNKKICLSQNTNKCVWEEVNKLRGTTRTHNHNYEINMEGKILTDHKDISTIFNEYFHSVPTKYRTNKNIHLNSTKSLHSMALFPVSEIEVFKVINNLKNKRTMDLQGISSWILKKCIHEITVPITHMINLSLNQGNFPKKLKITKITPIFKKGNQKDVCNYRPIAILPTISKIYEKVFLNQLCSYLERNHVIPKSQYGFQKGKSTIDAMTDLLYFIMNGMEKKKKVITIFLDLCKAFDCVDFEILLNKLDFLGVRGVPLNWLQSYLLDRIQIVQIEESLSEPLPVKYGVPQGSILGPILFIIYVYNMDLTCNTTLISYADDTTLCFESENNELLEQDIQIKGNQIVQYFEENNLNINFTKSNFIYFEQFNKRNGKLLPKVILNNHTITKMNSTLFLGLMIDENLNWKQHIEYISNKISSGIFALKLLKSYCDTATLLKAYYGIIYPHFTYGIALWGSASNTHIKRMLILQKRAIRHIAKLKIKDSCKEVFPKLKILTIPSIYVLEVCIYKKFKCTVNTKNENVHSYITRSKQNFRTNYHRTNKFKNFPSEIGTTFLNKLPNDISNESDLKYFKRKLKKLLLTYNFYNVQDFLNTKL